MASPGMAGNRCRPKVVKVARWGWTCHDFDVSLNVLPVLRKVYHGQMSLALA